MALLLDTFRDLERLTNQAFGAAWPTLAWPGAGWRSWVSSWMPMDGYRKGDVFCIGIDLPGVDPETIDLTVDNNVLTVQAERRRVVGEDVDLVISERPYGAFRRQVFLGDNRDADKIEASYEAGVLTLRIPVLEEAKPRKIEITGGKRAAIAA